MLRRLSLPLWIAWIAGLLAVGLLVAGATIKRAPAVAPDLATTLPATLDGWTAKAEPLGETPEASAWVAQTLNFDQSAQMTYTRGKDHFTVFAAYWNRGKMPARAVAIHTPDCCWSGAGYVCTETKFREAIPLPGAQLHPAEGRVFRAPDGEVLHVAFWQIVAGEPFDFGGKFNGAGDLWLNLKVFAHDALLGCREQLFVTISANQPIEELERDAGFQKVLRQLGGAGLTPGEKKVSS